jgi:hypothetical protein
MNISLSFSSMAVLEVFTPVNKKSWSSSNLGKFSLFFIFMILLFFFVLYFQTPVATAQHGAGVTAGAGTEYVLASPVHLVHPFAASLATLPTLAVSPSTLTTLPTTLPALPASPATPSTASEMEIIVSIGGATGILAKLKPAKKQRTPPGKFFCYYYLCLFH